MISFVNQLRRLAAERPDAVAVSCQGESITRAGLLERGGDLAVHLQGLGVRTGDLVTVALPNSIDWFVSYVAIWLLGLDLETPWVAVLFAVVDALLGTALGLLMSAFARTEFQAVQFMPLVVIPQLLLCGLLTPRDRMHDVLTRVSDVLPLSYAADAFTATLTTSGMSGDLWTDLAVLVGFCVAAVALASVTLSRRTA